MTATDDPTWDFRNPACKPRLLAVLRREANAMIEIATDPDRWHAPTACPGWEVRDMIGHLIDATEGYLGAFDSVRRGLPAPGAVGVHDMAAQSDRAARAFRSLARPELLERLRRGTDRLLEEFAGVFAEVRQHHFTVVAEGEAQHEVLHLVKLLWLDRRKLIQQKAGVPF